jgi:hypothetical protein
VLRTRRFTLFCPPPPIAIAATMVNNTTAPPSLSKDSPSTNVSRVFGRLI